MDSQGNPPSSFPDTLIALNACIGAHTECSSKKFRCYQVGTEGSYYCLGKFRECSSPFAEHIQLYLEHENQNYSRVFATHNDFMCYWIHCPYVSMITHLTIVSSVIVVAIVLLVFGISISLDQETVALVYE